MDAVNVVFAGAIKRLTFFKFPTSCRAEGLNLGCVFLVVIKGAVLLIQKNNSTEGEII
jgi:hypothetical protein